MEKWYSHLKPNTAPCLRTKPRRDRRPVSPHSHFIQRRQSKCFLDSTAEQFLQNLASCWCTRKWKRENSASTSNCLKRICSSCFCILAESPSGDETRISSAAFLRNALTERATLGRLLPAESAWQPIQSRRHAAGLGLRRLEMVLSRLLGHPWPGDGTSWINYCRRGLTR